MELSKEQEQQITHEVRQSFDALVEASTTLNTERYFSYFDSEKFVGLNANGTNWNSIADLKALIEPGFDAIDKVESLNFPNVRISVIDSRTAVLVNEFNQTVLLKTGETFSSSGGGTQVWSKASGQWKLVSVSASSNVK